LSRSEKSGVPELKPLTTEKTNRAASDLDLKSSLEIAGVINAEDARVAPAVKRALPEIARAIDMIAAALRKNGRLIYVGTGTSGRIAALDAAECPPTFSTNAQAVQFVIAGGQKALGAAVEADEDSVDLGRQEMANKNPGRDDVVVGIAASGRTPFTVAALQYARTHGAKAIALTCNRNSPLQRAADLTIVTEVGPEVVAGSSRMKAGTAQKMVLNMLSTGAMARLGYVYGNLMVNTQLKNSKLRERGIGILQRVTAVDRHDAENALKAANHRLPVALVMLQAKATRLQAERALKATNGHVRKAVAIASRSK
jgi:N-acetylmuramic acid 6-phosphate etherase